jgi:MYXO-CTERM domain-containing protein
VRRYLAVGVGLLAGAAAVTAQAAPCGRPDLVDMLPPDGATGVAVNATLTAHYVPAAEYLGEAVVLVTPAGDELTVPATFDSTEGLLSVVPAAPLEPGGSYEIRWPAVRGVNAAAPGSGGTARFTVGDEADAQPPTFAGVTGLAWDVERRHSDCTDALEERMVFDVELGAADDDGGRSQLTLLLYQTAGPMVENASVPVLARALPPDGTPAHILLPTDHATGHVCFAALVRDLAGQVSESGAKEVCAEVTTPPFFRGCSVGGGQTGQGGWGAAAALVLAIAAIRRRRAGPPRS